MFVLGVGLSHDASAVLTGSGELLAGVEEERINRMKHWNRVPLNAIRYCLDTAGIRLRDLDVIAVAGEEAFLDARLKARLSEHPGAPRFADFRSYFSALLQRELGAECPAPISFLNHHLCHAFSAYATSNLRDALVVALDGAGDGSSGAVYSARGSSVEQLAFIEPENSLGLLYEAVTEHLGYALFDEYKVMGLAPYGDPARFRDAFAPFVRLGDEGRFAIDRPAILRELGTRVPSRVPGSEFLPVHQDLAAALQDTIESIGMHFFGGLQRHTGQKNLCYAGGVAHNCSLNGKLLSAGFFESIFVAPAADDAGLALGAACLETRQRGRWPSRPRNDVFIGPAAVTGRDLTALLDGWRDLITYEKVPDIARRTAGLIADDCVVGWVQGRGEFGPRALGNRSILADPRPARNKDRINAMIKKREGFRPFAPSVAAERVGEYFVVPEGSRRFPSMSFVLQVQEAQRAVLGAVTHIDGSARVQTVTKDDNLPFWTLIDEFARLTGVAVLLNTSFNNHREPIVSSAADALACFLTTDLDCLVIDDCIIRKRGPAPPAFDGLFVSRTPMVAFEEDEQGVFSGPQYRSLRRQPIGVDTCRVLREADGATTLEALAARAGIALTTELRKAILHLWSERHVAFSATANSAPATLWPSTFETQWF